MGEIPRAVMFPFSPVFCAYGSSIMDVVHLYERSQRMMLLAPLTGAPAVDRDAFNAMVARAAGRGQARGRGRGTELGRRRRQPRARHALRRPDPLQARVLAAAVPGVRGRRAGGLRALRAGVQRGVHRRWRSTCRAASTSTRSCCASRCRGRSSTLPTLETTGEPPSAAAHAARRTSAGGWTRRSTSSRRSRPGHGLAGPAIVQAAYTTAVIPPGTAVHHRAEHGLGILEREN